MLSLVCAIIDLSTVMEWSFDLFTVIDLLAAFKLYVIVNQIDCPDVNVVNVILDIIDLPAQLTCPWPTDYWISAICLPTDLDQCYRPACHHSLGLQ